MSKLNDSDVALLQARHAYNDAKVVKVVDGGGFTVGKDTVTIEMNRMAFGLFEQSILNAFTDRPDLRERNPELVAAEKPCEACKGVGNFPITDPEKLKENYDDFYMWEDKLDEDAPPFEGWSCATFCSPCQGTGIVLKSQKVKE